MKPLIIGEAPSKNEEVPQPIAGRVGRRLADCAGMTLEDFLTHFQRTNLLQVRQDTALGFEFDHAQASLNAMQIRGSFRGGLIVLLLGHRVARAFGLTHADYFVQYDIDHAEVRVLPHPSAVNRWWNDPENYKQACDFMQNIVRRTR